MQNETITITIKKRDFEYLRAFAATADGAVQALSFVAARVTGLSYSQQKTIAEISLASTQGRQELERILNEVENEKI